MAFVETSLASMSGVAALRSLAAKGAQKFQDSEASEPVGTHRA